MRFERRENGHRDGRDARCLEAAIVARREGREPETGVVARRADARQRLMQRRRASAGRRSAHDRVAVAGDVDVHHRCHLRAIERLREEGGSLKPVLLHVEEHDLDAMPQPTRRASASATRVSTTTPAPLSTIPRLCPPPLSGTASRCAPTTICGTVASKGLEQHVLSLFARIALTRVVGERLQREREPALP